MTRKDTIVERVEAGAGRRGLPLPVKGTYTLHDLLPRRPDDPSKLAYKLPGEMGRELARAFERVFDLVDRGYGGLEVRAPSRILSPRWHRVLHRLHHHGLAQTIQLSQPLDEGIPLYYFDIGSPFLAHQTDGGRPDLPRFSRGFSEDYNQAVSKVVGECLERAPLLYFRMADFVRGSARSLRASGRRILEPAEICVFSAAQRERRPELRFDDDSVFRWTGCTSLITSEEALLPAQLVYWNYPVAWGDVPEPMLREGSSHGAGGFFSVEGAILSGALECVQRDGFFLHWMRGVAPPRIDVSTIRRPATLALVEHARGVGLEPMFFDITTELGIPVCLCILRRADDKLPHVTMGGSCRLDGESALHDALLEAASVHHVVARDTTRIRVPDDWDPLTDPTFYAHKRIGFWANPENARHLDFFLQGKTTSVSELCHGVVASKDARENLAFVVDVLRRNRMDAWYTEARHAALDELGYASVRVVIPALIPLYYQERNAPLGLQRLYDAPFFEQKVMSLPTRRCPHPFP